MACISVSPSTIMNSQTNKLCTHSLHPRTPLKLLIYRQEQKNILPAEDGEKMCVFWCVCVMTFLDSKDRVCFLSRFLLFLQQQWSSGSSGATTRTVEQQPMAGQDREAPRLMGATVCPRLLCCFYGDLKYNMPTAPSWEGLWPGATEGCFHLIKMRLLISVSSLIESVCESEISVYSGCLPFMARSYLSLL